jgi:hypothetical protein
MGTTKKLKLQAQLMGKNFYWKIDTGSAVTCMNINAFETAFGKSKEKKQKHFKTDIFIKKEVYTVSIPFISPFIFCVFIIIIIDYILFR